MNLYQVSVLKVCVTAKESGFTSNNVIYTQLYLFGDIKKGVDGVSHMLCCDNLATRKCLA